MAMGNLSKSLSEPGAPLWSVQEAKALLFSRSPGEQIFSCKPNSQPHLSYWVNVQGPLSPPLSSPRPPTRRP